jgi:hypothetical protein
MFFYKVARIFPGVNILINGTPPGRRKGEIWMKKKERLKKKETKW